MENFIASLAAIVVPLAGFAVVSLYTPGPNNILLATSGANFGFRRTLPHVLGVAGGFAAMLLLVAVALGALFQAFPATEPVLTVLGAGIMLWIAWRIATAGRSGNRMAPLRPFTFWQAVGFQWINGKAWSMQIGVASTFINAAHPFRDAIICSLVFFFIGLTSSTTWTLFGASIRQYLSSDTRFRAFNLSMGFLLAAFVFYMLYDSFASGDTE